MGRARVYLHADQRKGVHMGMRWNVRAPFVSADRCAAEYDVVVVGAGPAGIMAAIEGARGGARVLLVEAGALPRYKSCGGMLNLYTRRALEPFGGIPDEMVLDPRWISFRYHHLDYGVMKATDVRFLNVDREMFDEWLLSLLPPSVSVLPSTRLVDVAQSPAFVEAVLRGADASGRRSERVVRARYLIAADGPRATVRERLGIRPFDRYITVQEYVRIEPGALEPYFDALCCRRFSRDYGIGYLMPKGDVAIVGSVFYPGSRECERKHEEVLEILRERYPLGPSVRREKWFAAHLRRPADLVAGRGRILLAGEGGGFLSCTSGEGISFALNSGSMAGSSVAEALAGDCRVSGEALARYGRKLRPMKRNLEFRMGMFPLLNSTLGKTVACAVPTPLVSKVTERL